MAHRRPGRGKTPAGTPRPPDPAAAVARLAVHHGLPVPPWALDEALGLVRNLDVLPADREARALDLIDQALGHRRLAGADGPLEVADLSRVAGLWAGGGESP